VLEKIYMYDCPVTRLINFLVLFLLLLGLRLLLPWWLPDPAKRTGVALARKGPVVAVAIAVLRKMVTTEMTK